MATLTFATMGSVSHVALAATPGSQLWAKLYNGPANSNDSANVVAASPDGSEVFVSGQSFGSTSGGDYATVAYNTSTGAKLWAKRYNGSGNDYDNAYALGVSPDGSRVFVTGISWGSFDVPDYATVAYDASNGAVLWEKRYNGPAKGFDSANGLAVSPDGSRVFVTGFSAGSSSGGDAATLAYDASTGAKVWVKRYNGPANGNDNAIAIGVSSDGSELFVTGSSAGATSGDDYVTLGYDTSSGGQLWAKRYNGPGDLDDDATALGVSPDGSTVFTTGVSQGSSSGTDFATVAYDATDGGQLWAKRYNGAANLDDNANALSVSPDGSWVFVTGGSIRTGGQDYATVAYDASTGAKLWAKRSLDASSTDTNGLGVSPDSSQVFMAGGSIHSTSDGDYVTVAYDASTGDKLWSKLYGAAAANDRAKALSVSPDGSQLFVTGQSYGSSGGDYATVAYVIA